MDRYTKGFVVASLVYFFLAAVLGIWMGGADAGGVGAVRPRPLQPARLHVDDDLRGGVLHPAPVQRAHAALAVLGPRPLLHRQHRADRDGRHRARSVPPPGSSSSRPCRSLSAGMFAVNLGATMLMEPKPEGRGTSPRRKPLAAALPPLRRHAGGRPPPRRRPPRRGSTRTCGWARSSPGGRRRSTSSWGTASPLLQDPEHREQVKQIPITLRMACQRHNVDLDYMVSELNEAISPASARKTLHPEWLPQLRRGQARRKEGGEGETLQGGDDRDGPHPRRDPRGVPRDGEGVPEILRGRLLLLPRAGDGVRETERDDAQRERKATAGGTEPRRGVLNPGA